MAIDKKAVRQFTQDVRDTLNKEWDPIGVYDLDDPAFKNWPEDEYQGYVGKLSALLQRSAPDEEFLKYLEWAEVEHMGVGPFNRARAERLIFLLQRLEISTSSN
jgi:hypothetical protein